VRQRQQQGGFVVSVARHALQQLHHLRAGRVGDQRGAQQLQDAPRVAVAREGHVEVLHGLARATLVQIQRAQAVESLGVALGAGIRVGVLHEGAQRLGERFGVAAHAGAFHGLQALERLSAGGLRAREALGGARAVARALQQTAQREPQLAGQLRVVRLRVVGQVGDLLGYQIRASDLLRQIPGLAHERLAGWIFGQGLQAAIEGGVALAQAVQHL
jgi:hypothetical protein